MNITIDSAGRLVIPKAIREHLGLTGGQSLSIAEREGVIEIEPAPTPMQLVDKGSGPVAVPNQEIPALSSEAVREAIERSRR